MMKSLWEEYKIAVLDTGIDKNNSDLSYIKGANFTSDKIDEFADDNGHGTKSLESLVLVK